MAQPIRCLATVLFTLAVYVAPLDAGIIFQHFGNTDPTTTNWTFDDSTIPTAVGPVSELGFDAWSVDDNSTLGGSTGIYSQTPSGSQVTDANLLGWTLRARVRIVDISDNLDFGAFFLYSDGVKDWDVIFGSESDGDPIVRLSTGVNMGPSYTLEGSGGGYHLYELIYDPFAGSADLFVNGVERISNYGGRSPASAPRVAWGAGQSDETGHGNWNAVEWEIASVPEPSSFVFCALSASILGARRYCRRRQTGNSGATTPSGN